MNRYLVKGFLPVEDHNKILSTLTSKDFPWFVSNVVSGDIYKSNNIKEYYFTHMFYDMDHIRSNYFNLLEPIIYRLPNLRSLVRIKANLYPNTESVMKHAMHKDQFFDLNSCLFYVNTNDGVTTFDDTKDEIKSEANSALFFNSHDLHCSSTCSDERYRITINFNYF